AHDMSSAYPTATTLSEGVRVEGDLILNHDAIVAREITGDLRCTGTVELTAAAHVRGSVHADTARIAGRVDGGVTAARQTELLPGVAIAGGIAAAGLMVAEGVTYDGTLRLTSGSSEIVQAPTPPEKMNIARNRARVEKMSDTLNEFAGVTGATHAGIRPRRRVPLPSVI
ncbi:MAG: polymer-forming cytoskeletal protein, partial [Planctomycetota bacterium]